MSSLFGVLASSHRIRPPFWTGSTATTTMTPTKVAVSLIIRKDLDLGFRPGWDGDAIFRGKEKIEINPSDRINCTKASETKISLLSV